MLNATNATACGAGPGGGSPGVAMALVVAAGLATCLGAAAPLVLEVPSCHHHPSHSLSVYLPPSFLCPPLIVPPSFPSPPRSPGSSAIWRPIRGPWTGCWRRAWPLRPA